MLNTMEIEMKKNPKFKVGHHVRTSKYTNFFAKGYSENWLENVFVLVSQQLEVFIKKNCKKQIKKNLE